MAATEPAVRDLERRLIETSELDSPAAEYPEEHAEEPEQSNQDTQKTGYELSDFLKERKTVFSIFNIFRGIPEDLKRRHALKVALGKEEYDKFYKRTVYAAIKSAYERGIITPETLKQCSDMVSADWKSIPVYETSLDIRTRNSTLNKRLNNEGGLYKVEIFLPDGTKLTNFVKRYAKRELFEKAAKMQEYLSELKHVQAIIGWDGEFDRRIIDPEPLGLVARPQYVDNRNMLVAEEFLNGKTLRERLKENPDQKMSLLKEAIYNWALLSLEATKGVKDKDYYPQIPTDRAGKSILGEINFSQSFVEHVLAQGKEFSGMKQSRRLEKIRQDEELHRLAEMYYSEIASHLNSADKVFTHGDFHLDNIIFTEEGVRFIDWEGPKLTVPQYDLYKLIRRSDVTPAEEKELVMHAFESMYTLNTESDMREELRFLESRGYYPKEVEKVKEKINRLREQNKEAKEEQSNLFWQNYLRCRVHMDLERAAKDVDKARGGKEHREESLRFAAAAFNRALDTLITEELLVGNGEFNYRLLQAGRRLFGEDCSELGKDTGYLTRHNCTMQSAGTYTVMHMEEAFLKGEKRKRKLKKSLKIGAFAALLLGTGAAFLLDYLDRKELRELEQQEAQHYSALVQMSERPEPIIIDTDPERTEEGYPLIIDPTEPADETADHLSSEQHMQDATTSRARIFGTAMYPECLSDPGFAGSECGRIYYPVQAYNPEFPHVGQDIIKALILTSEWMNSKGVYGRWGNRYNLNSRWCNSPIIFYDGSTTSLTRCNQLMDPENNVLYAYSRLEELLSDGAQLEDAVARLFLGDKQVSQYKELSGETNYYRYSRYNSGNLRFPQEARDFVGGFKAVYDKIKGQENGSR